MQDSMGYTGWTVDITDRIQFCIALTFQQIGATVPRSISQSKHLAKLCVLAVKRQSRYHLWSSSTIQLAVPSVKHSNYGACSFSVSGPRFWNTLLDYFRDLILSTDTFERYLKHFLFALY